MLKDEPAATEVELLLRGGDAVIGAVNLAEALDVLTRRDGFAESEVQTSIEPLTATGLQVRPAGGQTAWSAARLRCRHYHRRDRPLSLADCFALATSLDTGRLATADTLLADVARREGIEVVALPNSDGVRP